MKQLTSFVLLCLFLYNLVGFYPAYTWRQRAFRRQAEVQRRAQLPDQALVKIRLAKNDQGASGWHWRDQQELEWRGRLYDVVRQQTDTDSITYFCWHDQGEEKLVASLKKQVDELTHPDADAGKTAKKLLDHLHKLAFFSPVYGHSPVALILKATPHRGLISAALRGQPATVVLPPPEGLTLAA